MQYEEISHLGKGSYGDVFLVRKRETETLYAAKRFETKSIDVKSITSEVLSQFLLKSPIAVNLHD